MPPMNEKQKQDMFQTLAITAAKALREIADKLDDTQDPGYLASLAGETHGVSFRLLNIAQDWMNSERKAAA